MKMRARRHLHPWQPRLIDLVRKALRKHFSAAALNATSNNALFRRLVSGN